MPAGQRGPGRQTLMHHPPSSTPLCRSSSRCCSAWHLQQSQSHASCLSLWSCPLCTGSLALPEGRPHLAVIVVILPQCYIGHIVMLPVVVLFCLLQLGLCIGTVWLGLLIAMLCLLLVQHTCYTKKIRSASNAGLSLSFIWPSCLQVLLINCTLSDILSWT